MKGQDCGRPGDHDDDGEPDVVLTRGPGAVVLPFPE